MLIDFEAYLKALAATPIDAKTEHTDRGALERLLKEAAKDADGGFRIQHEPRRDRGGGGSPDYMVKRDARIVGYVEVKTIDEALSKVLRSDQIKKYQKLSDNLILTDYLEFIWLKGGKVQR
ncbi:MAG: DNA methyltransferase, partial [Phenylobacterium sp.]|nr:DNA methyltransferase [Phenylobacterium sp.]